MVKLEKIELIVEGGKATPTPAVAQKLGPMKINIGQVMSDVNKKTEPFRGMKVPVKLSINPEDKSYSVDVGTPPVSELIRTELKLEKGSGQPNREKIGNMAIEQVIKVAKMKHDSMLSKTLKASVKQVIGSANAMGLLVEGKIAREINGDVDQGKFDQEITAEKIDVSKEKNEQLKIQLAKVQEELKKIAEREAAEEAEAKAAAGVTTAPKEGEAAAVPTKEAGKEGVKEAPAAGKEAGKEGAKAAPVAPGKEAKPAAKEGKPAAGKDAGKSKKERL